MPKKSIPEPTAPNSGENNDAAEAAAETKSLNGLYVNNRINAYLCALSGAATPSVFRGRRTRATTEEQLAYCEQALEGNSISPLERLKLVQRRIDLSSMLAGPSADTVDMEALEEEFVRLVPSYAERHGISYGAFREVGVPARVLKQAGIR